jgi:hypothetical protein
LHVHWQAKLWVRNHIFGETGLEITFSRYRAPFLLAGENVNKCRDRSQEARGSNHRMSTKAVHCAPYRRTSTPQQAVARASRL